MLANQMGRHPQPWNGGVDLPCATNMSFREIIRDGKCRKRKDHAPANFTPVKDMAHNLARTAPGKDSFRIEHITAPPYGAFLARLPDGNATRL